MLADELRRQADVFNDLTHLQSRIGHDLLERPTPREASPHSTLGVNPDSAAPCFTSGVVLSTLCHAADYRLLVVGDCSSDGDEETHRVLPEKVFPRQATITTAAGVAQAIAAGQ
jgi:hypothetical protein